MRGGGGGIFRFEECITQLGGLSALKSDVGINFRIDGSFDSV